MTAPSIGAGEAAVIAAGIAASVQFIPWLAKAIGKRRLDARRMTIESVRHDQDRLNGSFRRLEAENTRLSEENTRIRDRVASLETALGIERDLHAETKGRCTQMERAMRRAGIEMPEENGDPT